MEKPKPYRRPLSHNIRHGKENFKRFFTSAPSNSLQTWAAIFTIVLGFVSLGLSVVVYMSKQDIKDMDRLIGGIIAQNRKQDSLLFIQHTLLQKIDSQYLELKTMNGGVDSIYRAMVANLVTSSTSLKQLQLDSEPNLVVNSIDFKKTTGDSTFTVRVNIENQVAPSRTDSTYYYISINVSNAGVRLANDIKCDLYLFNPDFDELLFWDFKP